MAKEWPPNENTRPLDDPPLSFDPQEIVRDLFGSGPLTGGIIWPPKNPRG